MKDKLNQFIANLQGQFVEVSDATNKNQCMDLVYNWVFALGFPKATIQNLYAYEAFTKPKDVTLQHFDLIPNTPDAIPQDGDIVVWSNKLGVAGHIAIALGGGNTSKLKVFEQNNPLGSNAHVSERPYTHILGWLRPKIITPTDLPFWFKSLLSENGIGDDPESKVREIFDQSKKYDSAQKERDRALRDLAEARGDATKFEENFINSNREIKRLNDEIDTLRKSLSDRDKELTTIKARVTALEAQLDPGKVIVITREEYARITAHKVLDKFTALELVKEIFKRIFRKRGDSNDK